MGKRGSAGFFSRDPPVLGRGYHQVSCILWGLVMFQGLEGSELMRGIAWLKFGVKGELAGIFPREPPVFGRGSC